MSVTTTKKKKSDDEIVWIYAVNKMYQNKKKRYEFHPKLQEHIETCYQNGRKTCKLYIFGLTWTLDFERKLKISPKRAETPIRRIRRGDLKKHNVLGVSGTCYPKPYRGFKQPDGVCHICLYKPTIPTRVETCGHIFCYMCLKSNFTMGMECPTCRAEIPLKLFDWPIRNDLDIHLECPEEYAKDCAAMFEMNQKNEKNSRPRKPKQEPVRRSSRSTRTKYYWIYESHTSGWYRYDPKNERYMEECFIRKKKKCVLFIAGAKMNIHFKNKTQTRDRGGPKCTRKIKRIRSVDIEKYPLKGIAGIRGYVRVVQ